MSQDGGVPLVSKRWDGHASDTAIVKERAEAFVTTFARAETPRYLVADAKLSSEDTAATLSQLGFITRIPATLKLVSQVIRQALQWDTWHSLNDTTRYQSSALGHYGMAPRGLVVSSQAALERADKSVTNTPQREREALKKQLFHWQAKRFETPEAAQAALAALANAWRSPPIDTTWLSAHTRYACQGRPPPQAPSRRWSGRCKPRADPIRRALRPVNNRGLARS